MDGSSPSNFSRQFPSKRNLGTLIKNFQVCFSPESRYMSGLVVNSWVAALKIISSILCFERDWFNLAAMLNQKRRDLVCARLAQMPRLSYLTPESGMFIMVNISAFFKDDKEFAEKIARCRKAVGITRQCLWHGHDGAYSAFIGSTRRRTERRLQSYWAIIKGPDLIR